MSPALAPPGRRAPATGIVARWTLHLALIAALGAFVVARDDRSALLLLIPLAAAPALRWRRAPRGLVALLPAAARMALLGVLAIAVVSRQLRFVRDDTAFAWGGFLGWTLAVLAVVFILGHRIWPVTTTLVPAIVGLLVASGLKPGVTLFPWFVAGAALALWAYAFVQGGPRRIGLPLGVFLLVAGAVAVGDRPAPAVGATPRRARVGGDLRRRDHRPCGGVAARRVRTPGGVPACRPASVDLRAPPAARVRSHPLRRSGVDLLEAWAGGTGAAAAPAVARERDRALAARCARGCVPGAADRPGARGRRAGIVETRIVQSAVEDWPLLLPASALLIRAPTSLLLSSREGELRWPRYEPARLYGVIHDTASAASRGEDEGLSARAAALGVPGRLDPRVRVLAGTLAADARSGPARLRNTIDWMQKGYAYSLDVGRFETADPLAEFLFDKKRGYCEYFATAAAVLLRLQGIPTRYVKGFAVGPQNLVPGRLGVEDHYVVREQDAHAWVEAYIEGVGWVEADPTPPVGFAEVHTLVLRVARVAGGSPSGPRRSDPGPSGARGSRRLLGRGHRRRRRGCSGRCGVAPWSWARWGSVLWWPCRGGGSRVGCGLGGGSRARERMRSPASWLGCSTRSSGTGRVGAVPVPPPAVSASTWRACLRRRFRTASGRPAARSSTPATAPPSPVACRRRKRWTPCGPPPPGSADRGTSGQRIGSGKRLQEGETGKKRA